MRWNRLRHPTTLARMKPAPEPPPTDRFLLRGLPPWVQAAPGDGVEHLLFSAGAALALLDLAQRDPVGRAPLALLRDRQALNAAEACLRLERRSESQARIRNAVCLVRVGGAPGPAGEMFLHWRRLAQADLRGTGWSARLAQVLPDHIGRAVPLADAERHRAGSPVAQAAAVLVGVLAAFPREEAAALMLADLALARALRWPAVLPLVAMHLGGRQIRTMVQDQDQTLPILARAVIAACDAALRHAADLERRARRLHAVAPKLRARGAAAALRVFLTHDAVSASSLLSPGVGGGDMAMTDRAARRLCDRLVSLGALRELTGRPSFRLYGL